MLDMLGRPLAARVLRHAVAAEGAAVSLRHPVGNREESRKILLPLDRLDNVWRRPEEHIHREDMHPDCRRCPGLSSRQTGELIQQIRMGLNEYGLGVYSLLGCGVSDKLQGVFADVVFVDMRDEHL